MKDIWIISGPTGRQSGGVADLCPQVQLFRNDHQEASLIQEQSWKDFYGSADLLSSLCLPDTEVWLKVEVNPVGPDSPHGDYWLASSEQHQQWLGAPFSEWHREAAERLLSLKAKVRAIGFWTANGDRTQVPHLIALSHFSAEESLALFKQMTVGQFALPGMAATLMLSLQASQQSKNFRKILVTVFAGLLIPILYLLPSNLERQRDQTIQQVLLASETPKAAITLNHARIPELLGKFGRNDRANLRSVDWLWGPTGQSALWVDLERPRKKPPKGCELVQEGLAYCAINLTSSTDAP